MPPSTTVRVTQSTRDGLRDLAKDDGITLDEEISNLVRAERQRRMGRSLAAMELPDEDRAWMDAGIETARRDAGR